MAKVVTATKSSLISLTAAFMASASGSDSKARSVSAAASSKLPVATRFSARH